MMPLLLLYYDDTDTLKSELYLRRHFHERSHIKVRTCVCTKAQRNGCIYGK